MNTARQITAAEATRLNAQRVGTSWCMRGEDHIRWYTCAAKVG